MPYVATKGPVLTRFRAALADLYGERIERVVLFGSRARGDARPYSDYDIAIFLRPPFDRWAEIERRADMRVDFLEATGAFLEARPYAAGSYEQRTPLMHEIRKDGFDL